MLTDAHADHPCARDTIERLHADMLAAVAVWRTLLPPRNAWIGDGPVQDE